MDLHEFLTNFGSTWFRGGLNLAAQLLGKPGKMMVQGDMVHDLYAAGKVSEINEYCRCDVLDTYFVFLRVALLMGQITLEREQELVKQTKVMLEADVKRHRLTHNISSSGAIGRIRGAREALASVIGTLIG